MTSAAGPPSPAMDSPLSVPVTDPQLQEPWDLDDVEAGAPRSGALDIRREFVCQRIVGTKERFQYAKCSHPRCLLHRIAYGIRHPTWTLWHVVLHDSVLFWAITLMMMLNFGTAYFTSQYLSGSDSLISPCSDPDVRFRKMWIRIALSDILKAIGLGFLTYAVSVCVKPNERPAALKVVEIVTIGALLEPWVQAALVVNFPIFRPCME